ncbi:NTP transferase domain-containing protein [Ammoniphilus sp. CFH 90114]|uniref:cytidylyltransferase domain-containing protein n=1 Tax=Ammoniphilus sp. CFH 90114 TaxID=2493665 RepID=UPI00100EE514|nr:glycosyltransferase family protein [Ammoniphilus sp. CFH 90114]RXT04463.1 acylneuraminate cytidylyltransferase [Ammoniphilus sp. CFH 90114]
MKTIIIIQARMGSTRLPGKVLRPLGTTDVLSYVVARCQAVEKVSEVIVATSTLPEDEAIEQWCREKKVSCFRGSQDDVLLRYIECARERQPDYVIRVTSDCPFIDYHLMEQIMETMEKHPSDLVRVEGELPRGLVSEMFSFQALNYIHQHGYEPRHREHVTYYAYEYPEKFQAASFEAPRSMRYPQFRITLDTSEDYAMLQEVANHFADDMLVCAQKVVDFLRDHPEVAKINVHIEQKPVV